MDIEEGFIYINSVEELKAFKQASIYILYFSSEDCNVCHSVFPRLLELNKESELPLARIDVTKNLEIAGQHLVFNIPTILIFNEGVEVLRESRFIDFDKIEMIIGQKIMRYR